MCVLAGKALNLKVGISSEHLQIKNKLACYGALKKKKTVTKMDFKKAAYVKNRPMLTVHLLCTVIIPSALVAHLQCLLFHHSLLHDRQCRL